MKNFFNWSAGTNGVLEYGEVREASAQLHGSPTKTPTVTLATANNAKATYTAEQLTILHDTSESLSQRDIDGLSRLINKMTGARPEPRDVRPQHTRGGEGMKHTRFPTQKGPNRR